MRRIPLAILVLSAGVKGYPVSVAAAQGVVVQVVDSVGIPVPFALVDAGKVTGRLTDSVGTARFPDSKGDSLRVFARRIGYAPFNGLVGRGTENGVFRVMLTRIARTLDGVHVTAERSTPLSRAGFYDRMQRVQRGAIVGEFITPEELDQRGSMQISRLLEGRRHTSVIRVGSRRRAMVAGRGGMCPVTVLVDGQRVNDLLEPPNRTSLRSARSVPMDDPNKTSIDELLSATAVAGIEIYPSMANAPHDLIPLTGGGSCGLIAIWTGGRQ